MDKTDILIIGAGVVGLAVAKELSFISKDVIIIEKNKSFGQETSSRNSEVIHGGMYYPSGTLKAELCVNGRHLLYQLCDEKKIPHKKVGKLIIATDKFELSALEAIFAQGKNNGVEGLEIISKAQINKLEPKVSGIAALHSPETGIIDSHRLMDYLLTIAKENGASVAYNAEVTAIKMSKDGYKVIIKNNSEIIEIKALVVINCAGLDSDIVAGMVGIDTVKEKYNLYYCKGQYFRVSPDKSRFINRLVYPVPQFKSGGLGIHATPDLAGSLRLGPDDNYLDERAKDYSVDGQKRMDFFASAVKFLPFLEEGDLVPDTAGIRPKLQPRGGEFRDFIIRDEAEKSFPGFINLVGIESPGLTASPAIAGMVKEMVSIKCA
jgi:L-2-hydroxyglutarate oxidase LhgO